MRKYVLTFFFTMTSTIIETSDQKRSRIERFCRTFAPASLPLVSKLTEELEDLSGLALTDALYKRFIQNRFILLKKQENVSFPTQRTKEWFAERKRIPSTISGSRPAGWYFGLTNRESYDEHLAYIHYGKKQHFDAAALKRMSYGTQFEDTACYRFIEWSLRNGLDAYVYETGFVRNKTYPFLGASPDGLVGICYTGTVCGYRLGTDDTPELLMVYDDLVGECRTAVVRGKAAIEAALAHEPKTKESESKVPPSSTNMDLWDTLSSYQGKRISRIVHSVLEIKCPEAKIYSTIPSYYLAQLHLEMASFNVTEAFFVCWHQKNGKERTRVWKIKFNAGFFETFVNDIVELFRSDRGNNKRGTEWPTFREQWFQFKRTFSSVKVWEPYVKKFFEARKYSLEKPYVEQKKTKQT